MSKPLKLYVMLVVALGAVALGAATLLSSPDGLLSSADPGIALRVITSTGKPAGFEIGLGILFWIVLTLVSSALPVELPRGIKLTVSMAPIVAAMVLGGPAVGGWVAALGTTELREIRGR